MSAEEKLRMLAAGDTALQGYLASGGLFRWFDRRLPQGYITQGPCVVYRRVSTVFTYRQQGLSSLNQPLLQLDVIDYDPIEARAIGEAIKDFMKTISLAHKNQFDSPYTTPPQFPNFLLNQRAGEKKDLQPLAYTETLDYRVYNDDTI